MDSVDWGWYVVHPTGFQNFHVAVRIPSLAEDVHVYLQAHCCDRWCASIRFDTMLHFREGHLPSMLRRLALPLSLSIWRLWHRHLLSLAPTRIVNRCLLQDGYIPKKHRATHFPLQIDLDDDHYPFACCQTD